MVSLEVNGENIYTSQLLQPGESLEGIVLDAPLAAGSYEAVSITSIYDENGECLFTNRIPIAINVAE